MNWLTTEYNMFSWTSRGSIKSSNADSLKAEAQPGAERDNYYFARGLRNRWSPPRLLPG